MSDERRHEWVDSVGVPCSVRGFSDCVLYARGDYQVASFEMGILAGRELIRLSAALATSEAAREKAEAERLTLETRVASQRHEIANQNENARRYVLRLDALHFVWCDGPCASGTHRWSDKTITEEVVDEAERNTKRLRTWFDNQKLLAARVSKGEEHGS